MEQWIIEVITAFGYVGIFFLMLAENLFPPIPSEVIVPVAGLAVGAGRLGLLVVVLAALAGTLIGNLPWFVLARMLGRERFVALVGRYGRYAAVKPEDVDAAIDWFDRHGAKAVLIGRFAPGVRTLISVPAGLSSMPFGTFLLLSAVGSTFWIGLLLAAGMLLHSNWHLIADVLGPLGKILVVLVALGLVGFVAWRRRRERRAARDDPAAPTDGRPQASGDLR
jgi:membrane protein DedA with SNARE-associated domain